MIAIPECSRRDAARKRAALKVVVAAAMTCATSSAVARGVSPYLPLSTSPEIERQIERVLILAGRPVVRRPIPAALVLDALPHACEVDAVLCEQVRAYLDRFQHNAGVTQLQADVAITTGDSDRVLPNSHGRLSQSHWQVVGSAYYQPSDYLLLNAGGIAYQGRAKPTGSVVSAGFDFAQLDIGFRDHWFSPMTTSAFLISTEAPTMPSVTLSNYRPLGSLGFTYELFAARMSKQTNIPYFATTTEGNPHLAGIQLGIAPVTGYALTLNRVMQYGGGARGGAGLKDLFKAFYKNNTGNSNVGDDPATGHLEFGNQVAGVTGTMQFPGRVPFSVNVEYSGEDGSFGGNQRLGDVGFSLGVDFPVLWQQYDFKYELSEWQNVWYTHHLYPLGLTNDEVVLGHWFGDQRQFSDRVGGHSHLLQVGMRAADGAYWRASYRMLAFVSSLGFQTLPPVPYRHQHEVGIRYARSVLGRGAALDVTLGRDAFGKKYGRLDASVDLLPMNGGAMADELYDTGDAERAYEVFVDLGVNHSRVKARLVPGDPQWETKPTDYHAGFGVRRAISDKSDLGMRLELDRIDSRHLLSLRALDYRRQITRHVALSAFAGVGRYSDGAPAYGWYRGVGAGWKNVLPRWDLNADFRDYDKLTRNRVLSGDAPTSQALPRIHYDVRGFSLYATRRF